MHIDANDLYGWALSESLPYDKIKFLRKVELEVILKTSNLSEFRYFAECDKKYSDNLKQKKNKKNPFAPKIEIISIKKINDNDFMKESIPHTYKTSEK